MKKTLLNLSLLLVLAVFMNAIPSKNNQNYLSHSKFSPEFNPTASPLELNIIQVEPSNQTTLDGNIKITVKGGKAPYTLVVHTNTRTKELTYKGENFDLKNLGKGFYMLNITDSEGNFTSETINL